MLPSAVVRLAAGQGQLQTDALPLSLDRHPRRGLLGSLHRVQRHARHHLRALGPALEVLEGCHQSDQVGAGVSPPVEPRERLTESMNLLREWAGRRFEHVF